MGDAYQAVSGVPIVTKFHAVYICNLAMEMLETMRELPDPSHTNQHLTVRLGMYFHQQPCFIQAIRETLDGDAHYQTG